MWDFRYRPVLSDFPDQPVPRPGLSHDRRDRFAIGEEEYVFNAFNAVAMSRYILLMQVVLRGRTSIVDSRCDVCFVDE